MRRYFSLSSLALALAMIATAATTSHAATTVVLFSDDFEGRTTGSGDGNGNPAGAGNGSSSWGTNNNNLGGTNTAAYITTPNRGGGANQVVGQNPFEPALGNHGHLLNGTSVVGYQGWLSEAPDGFEIGFRFDRNTDPGASATEAAFLSMGLGVNSLTPSDLAGAASISRTNFGLLFQQANNGNAANASTFDSNVLQSNFDYFDPTAAANVLVAITPTIPGAYGSGALIGYSVAVNGTVLNSGIFVGNGEDLSRVSFSANNFSQRYIDNLTISSVTAIPEPSTTAALAIAGLGGVVIARRRKKASVAKV